jgi:hypothetical protein
VHASQLQPPRSNLAGRERCPILFVERLVVVADTVAGIEVAALLPRLRY